MTEEEVQKKLQDLHDMYINGKVIEDVAVALRAKKDGARTIYLAGGWWGEYQPELLVKAYEALLANPTVSHIHVPLLHQYGGNAFVDGKFEPDYEWASMTYKADLRGIDNTDLTVALFPVKDQDTGTAVEVGYAVASHKPVVGVFDGDAHENPINLMISMSADASVKTPEELENFDFLDINPNMYDGRLI